MSRISVMEREKERMKQLAPTADFRQPEAVMTQQEKMTIACRLYGPDSVECLANRAEYRILAQANNCFYQWNPVCKQRLTGKLRIDDQCARGLYNSNPEFVKNLCPQGPPPPGIIAEAEPDYPTHIDMNLPPDPISSEIILSDEPMASPSSIPIQQQQQSHSPPMMKSNIVTSQINIRNRNYLIIIGLLILALFAIHKIRK